ncbi:hypothetical protein J7M28_06935 [bacterium]|nr:hypothetical protein [bacterium]
MFITNHDYTFWGSLVLILAILSIGLMPIGGGAVLCRGADGGVEMKPGFGGSCHPHIISLEGSGLAESVVRSSQKDCCGTCNDTPLGNLDVSVSLCASKRTSHTDGLHCCAESCPTPAFDFVRGLFPSQSSASAGLILLTRRTVVLLI